MFVCDIVCVTNITKKNKKIKTTKQTTVEAVKSSGKQTMGYQNNKLSISLRLWGIFWRRVKTLKK